MRAHAWAETVELLRYPAFVIPTVGFPALFYLFFGRTGTATSAGAGMASYAAFAVFGVVFFQFGVGIAQERSSPWQLFLRVLPVAPWQRLVARLCSAALFAIASAGVVIAVALSRSTIALGGFGWLRLVVALAAGAVPFGLLGVALGYLLSARAALPIANLVYLGLSYLGGLWTGPDGLHGVARSISPYLPTRQWSDLVVGAVGAAKWEPASLLWLAAYAAAFAGLARFAYRRDELRQFD